MLKNILTAALTFGPELLSVWKAQVRMGYFRKYPHPPMDDTELGAQKFQDFQEGQLLFLQDSRAYWFKILRNSKISQKFEWFSWNFGQNLQHFVEICGFPVILTEHFLQDFQCRPWGCVDIFWNSPVLFSIDQAIDEIWALLCDSDMKRKMCWLKYQGNAITGPNTWKYCLRNSLSDFGISGQRRRISYFIWSYKMCQANIQGC